MTTSQIPPSRSGAAQERVEEVKTKAEHLKYPAKLKMCNMLPSGRRLRKVDRTG